MNIFLPTLILILVTSTCSDSSLNYRHAKQQEVSFDEITFNEGFWLPKISTIQNNTIPMLMSTARGQGILDNFRIIAGKTKQETKRYNAPDSDLYALIEAAGYSMAYVQNLKLKARIDSIIEIILSAQAKDGYLHTQSMLNIHDYPINTPFPHNTNKQSSCVSEPENKWESNTDVFSYALSPLYNAGRMMESAVAWYRGTGNRAFLAAAIKFADLICTDLDVTKLKNNSLHPEIQIGLMKIYHVTGDDRYLKHAELFSLHNKLFSPIEIKNIHKLNLLQPLQRNFEDSFRTAYLHSDIIDPEDRNSQYRAKNILHGQWSHSLSLLSGLSKYTDITELVAYNSLLSDIRLDGEPFFYSNINNNQNENQTSSHDTTPLDSFFFTPYEFPKFITGIGRWFFTKDHDYLYVNMFDNCHIKTAIANEEVALSMSTHYPWDSNIAIVFNSKSSTGLKVRIPSWNKSKNLFDDSPFFFKSAPAGFKIYLNNKAITPLIQNGYIVLNGLWNPKNKIEICFDMPCKRVYTQETIKEHQGRVALMRGPLLYGLEELDNDFELEGLVLPSDSPLHYQYQPELLNGIGTVTGKGYYGETPVTFTAIPYYALQNRGKWRSNILITEDPWRAIIH